MYKKPRRSTAAPAVVNRTVLESDDSVSSLEHYDNNHSENGITVVRYINNK